MEQVEKTVVTRKPTPDELSKSTDPLILDIKPVPSGIQSNDSERKNNNEEQKKADDATVQPATGEQQRVRSFSQTYDGVFANLSARPEVMVLPKEASGYDDAPPAYTDTRNHGQPRFMTMEDENLADSVDEVFLDDYEVGSVLAFAICVMVVIMFHVWGFLICFIISQSHASRKGSIAGLGLLAAFASLSMQSDLEAVIRPSLHGWIPFFSLAVGILGYMLFLYMLISYQKIRKVAESMVVFPGNQPEGIFTQV